MGYWGVKSYENDDADRALDAGFDRVHGARFEELMDDRSPLTLEQVQERLASPETLAAAVEALREEVARPFEEWDEVERLAYVGVVVRHAEIGVDVPDEMRLRALDWLDAEAIDWDEATMRKLRRDHEIRLLKQSREGV